MQPRSCLSKGGNRGCNFGSLSVPVKGTPPGFAFGSRKPPGAVFHRTSSHTYRCAKGGGISQLASGKKRIRSFFGPSSGQPQPQKLKPSGSHCPAWVRDSMQERRTRAASARARAVLFPGSEASSARPGITLYSQPSQLRYSTSCWDPRSQLGREASPGDCKILLG